MSYKHVQEFLFWYILFWIEYSTLNKSELTISLNPMIEVGATQQSFLLAQFNFILKKPLLPGQKAKMHKVSLG